MKRGPLLMLLVALSACSPAIEMQPGYAQGEYRISSFAIEAATPEIAADPEYIRLKSMLTEELLRRLQGRGNGQEVGMTVTVDDVSLEINAARAIMVGDAYRINSTVLLWNPASYTEVGHATIGAQTGQSGIAMAFGNPIISEEEFQRQVVSDYATRLLSIVYSKGDAS